MVEMLRCIECTMRFKYFLESAQLLEFLSRWSTVTDDCGKERLNFQIDPAENEQLYAVARRCARFLQIHRIDVLNNFMARGENMACYDAKSAQPARPLYN